MDEDHQPKPIPMTRRQPVGIDVDPQTLNEMAAACIANEPLSHTLIGLVRSLGEPEVRGFRLIINGARLELAEE